MAKILFINPHFRLFGTPTCGGANRSQMFLKALTQVGHVDVVSFWENEKSDLPNCDVIHSGCPEFGPLDSYGRVGKYIRLLVPWNANNIFPLSKSVEKFCDGFIANGNYDYIAVRYLFTAAEYGLLKYADRLIVDVDDNPKNTLQVRMRKAETRFQKLYYTMAAISAGVMSRLVLRGVHTSFYSNQFQSPSKHSVYLPNVPVNNTPLESVSDALPMKAIIVGSWAYYPNKHGLLHFVKKIWPIILQRIPEAKLDIIGKMDDERLKSTCDSAKGITVRGFVDDLRAEYENARCALVPVYYGSGTCVKVVEAMCLNRPFVSTSCGVRGLEQNIKSGHDYLLAKTDEDFARNTVSLFLRPNDGAILARNALTCAQTCFSQNAFNQIVKDNICKQ